MPAASWPITAGTSVGVRPSMRWRSLRQTPLATVFTITWPGPISSMSISSTTRGLLIS